MHNPEIGVWFFLLGFESCLSLLLIEFKAELSKKLTRVLAVIPIYLTITIFGFIYGSRQFTSCSQESILLEPMKYFNWIVFCLNIFVATIICAYSILKYKGKL